MYCPVFYYSNKEEIYSFANFGNTLIFLSVGRLIKTLFLREVRNQLRENCGHTTNNTFHDLINCNCNRTLSFQTPALPSEFPPESLCCYYSPERSRNTLVEYSSKTLATVSQIHVNHSTTIEIDISAFRLLSKQSSRKLEQQSRGTGGRGGHYELSRFIFP